MNETAKEKILVTGGTGFLGRAVLDELIARGARPFVLSRNPAQEFLNRYSEKINLITADVLDETVLEQVFAEIRPDKIVHLAGCAGKENKADILDEINYTATVKVLELARHWQVKRIVLTGTADEYGFQTAPQTETLAAMPVSDYAVSKNKAVEHALLQYEKHRLPIVVLRPFTIYGDGQPPAMFVAQAVECAVKNLPFEMSEGFQKRDLLFVTDLADAMMKALTAKNIEGEVYNVGSGTAIPLRDLARKIWRIAGADLENLKIGARRTNRNELHDTQADIAKIRAAFDWQPKVSLEDGLEIIIEKAKRKFNERKISVS